MCCYLLKQLQCKLIIFLSHKYYHEIVKVKADIQFMHRWSISFEKN
jgi:hypothetical protein